MSLKVQKLTAGTIVAATIFCTCSAITAEKKRNRKYKKLLEEIVKEK